MKPRALFLLVIVALAAVGGCGRQVDVTAVRYGRWDRCIQLSNGEVDVIVAPDIGRIVFYGTRGGENLLWEHPKPEQYASAMGGWNNYGGDKLWAWPQTSWNWPPPQQLDAGPYRAQIDVAHGQVELVGPESESSGVSGSRVISLDADGALHITSRITAGTDGSRKAIAPWTVTQVRRPQQIRAHLSNVQASPKADVGFPQSHQVAADWLAWDMDFATGGKVFVAADVLSAKVGERWLTCRLLTPSAGPTTAQIYQSATSDYRTLPAGAAPYCELEFALEPATLQRGEHLEMQVVYQLSSTPPR